MFTLFPFHEYWITQERQWKESEKCWVFAETERLCFRTILDYVNKSDCGALLNTMQHYRCDVSLRGIKNANRRTLREGGTGKISNIMHNHAYRRENWLCFVLLRNYYEHLHTYTSLLKLL